MGGVGGSKGTEPALEFSEVGNWDESELAVREPDSLSPALRRRLWHVRGHASDWVPAHFQMGEGLFKNSLQACMTAPEVD